MEFSDCFPVILMLTGIDQEISFQQDLIIRAVNSGKGMVMPDKITDPVKHFLIHTGILIKLPYQRRTGFFLKAA